MSIDPLWFPLIQQCIRNEAHQPVSRFIQLASLTSKGHASCRTVVFRGWHFLSSTPTLKIVTDIRSDKISGLRANPWAEVCWYFAEAREQFRLTGNVTIIDSFETNPSLAQIRLEQWQALSDSARQQFVWPTPGEPKLLTPNVEHDQDSRPPSSQSPEPPFALLLLEPSSVDYVNLRSNERKKFSRNANDQWHVADLNP